MDSQYLSPNSGEHFSNKQLLFDVDSFNESLAFYFPNLPRNGLTTEKGSNQGENASNQEEENHDEKGSVLYRENEKPPEKKEKGSVLYMENSDDEKGSVLSDKGNKSLDFNIGYEYRILKDIKEIIYSISFPEKNDLISSAEKRNLIRIQTENLIQIYTMIKLRFNHFKLNNIKNEIQVSHHLNLDDTK